MDIVSIYSARNYTNRKVAELGMVGGGGGDLEENPNRVNFVPTTPDPVPVGAANSTSDMDWFGEGAFLHVVEYTPSRDINGTLTVDLGADYAEMTNGYEFYIFDKDARTDNTANSLIDLYHNNPSDQFFLTGGVKVYLFWVDWNPVEGRVIDRGPIFNRLKTYELTGIVVDDGMFIQHLHEDGTVNWVKYPAPIGHSGAWAEGRDTIASGDSSHAEGQGSEATGQNSHAENRSRAAGNNSHSEGQGQALGDWSHAENYGTADGEYAHAENRATATGPYSHAENLGTALAANSHAQGMATATSPYEDAMGDIFSTRSTLPFGFSVGAPNNFAQFFVALPVFNDDVFASYVLSGSIVGFGPGRKVKTWTFQAALSHVPGTINHTEGDNIPYVSAKIIGTPTITVVGADAGTEAWTLEVIAEAVLNPADGNVPVRVMIYPQTHDPAVKVSWKGIVQRDTFMSNSIAP